MREDHINRAHSRLPCWNKQAYLKQHVRQSHGLHIGRLATAVWPGQDGDPPTVVKFCSTRYWIRRLAQCQMDIDQPFNLGDPVLSTDDFGLAEGDALPLKPFCQGHSRQIEANFLFQSGQWRTTDMHIAS